MSTANTIVELHRLPTRFDSSVEAFVGSAALRRLEATWLRRKSEEFSGFLAGEMWNVATPWFYTAAIIQGSGSNIGDLVGVVCAYFNPAGCSIRRRVGDSLELVSLPPYVNVGPSAIRAQSRGTGLYSTAYRHRLDVVDELYNTLAADTPVLLLSGVRGRLTDAMNRVYAQCEIMAAILPRDLFSAAEWSQLGIPRDESRGAEIMAIRYGFQLIGFKKTDGGPIYVRSRLPRREESV